MDWSEYVNIISWAVCKFLSDRQKASYTILVPNYIFRVLTYFINKTHFAAMTEAKKILNMNISNIKKNLYIEKKHAKHKQHPRDRTSDTWHYSDSAQTIHDDTKPGLMEMALVWNITL